MKKTNLFNNIFKILLFLMLLAVSYLGYQNFQLQEQNKTLNSIFRESPPQIVSPPKYDQIMAIINALEYSGIPAITRNNVSLDINFKNKTWTMRNLHKYTREGNIILEDNRFGLCGELAQYTFSKIQPLLGDNYSIKFAQVIESQYFPAPIANHVVLLILDTSNKNSYLLDPSLKKYDNVENFDEYLFIEITDYITDIKNQNPHVTFPIHRGTPLSIRNGYITNLNVSGNDGKFDKDNFIISISAVQHYKYTGDYIFALAKKNGKVNAIEIKSMIDKTFTESEFALLKKTILRWFKSVDGK